MPVQITQFLVGGFDENCTYICTDKESKQSAIVDPTGNINSVLKQFRENNLELVAIWLTHTHFDHYQALDIVQDQLGPIPIYVQEKGIDAVTNLGYSDVVSLEDGTVVSLGDSKVSVLHTPGHSDDSICFYIEATQKTPPLLISGDTLFVEGCGRTTPDNAPDLYQSLQRLKTLPENTILYPGHNYGPTPTSTIEQENIKNRFLIAGSYEDFFAERFPN